MKKIRITSQENHDLFVTSSFHENRRFFKAFEITRNSGSLILKYLKKTEIDGSLKIQITVHPMLRSRSNKCVFRDCE
jgi:hypothetical protein